MSRLLFAGKGTRGYDDRAAGARRGAAAAWCALLLALPLCSQAEAPNPRRTPIVDVVERVRGAVVNIHSERTTRADEPDDRQIVVWPTQQRVNGMGTGIVIDPRGYIVTNQHVVDDVQTIRIRLSDGASHTARVIAREFEADLALLKIDASRPLPTMPLGTAGDLMVGETVVAIGNAYGYEHTVSVGVVSAVKRDVTLNKDLSYKALIQTDASINPGNSGGPLVNVNGELVGVNVAIRAGAQGIGFAIPVDTMIRVTAEMMSGRKRNGIWHGVVARDSVESALAREASESQPASARSEGWRTKRELVVERVEASSPAAKAGLQRGDVIVQAGEVRVHSTLDLERAFFERSAGDKVALAVRRQDGEKRVELVLGGERAGAGSADLVWRKLGLRLSPVAGDTVSRASRQLHGGVAVTDLNPHGAAARAGVQRGDILVGLHQWETLTHDNVAFVLGHGDLASFLPLRFYIVRAGQLHRGWIPQVD